MNVKIFEQSPAQAISPGSDLTVHAEKGRIKSKYVLLAGNAYLSCNTPLLEDKSIPVSSFVGVTTPLSRASIQSILPRDVTVADCNKIPDYYQIIAGNRMLFGCGINFLGKEPKTFRKIIKKGWPGKIDTVLDRQTDLILLSMYGFYEYCAKVGKRERKAIHKDFTNMINLHLQDRLFF